MHVFRNVFTFPQIKYFSWFFTFFYVTSSKTLKIHVYAKVILFLLKGFFAYVSAFWYVRSLKTLKRLFLFYNIVLVSHIGCFPWTLMNTQKTRSWKFRFLWVFCMHFGVLVPNKMKYTQNTRFWYCCSVSPYKITKKLFSVLAIANEKKKKIRFSLCHCFPI